VFSVEWEAGLMESTSSMPEAVWSYTESKLRALFTEAHSSVTQLHSGNENSHPGSLQESPYSWLFACQYHRQTPIAVSASLWSFDFALNGGNFVTRPFWPHIKNDITSNTSLTIRIVRKSLRLLSLPAQMDDLGEAVMDWMQSKSKA